MEYRSRRSNVLFSVGTFDATRREVIVVIAIIALLLAIGIMISGAISDHYLDENERINKAVKIDTQEMFEYGMRTGIGDALVYGDLIAIDPVTLWGLDGEYMTIKRTTEEYTAVTKTEPETTVDADGEVKTVMKTKVVYEWVLVGSDSRCCKEVTFLGVTFDKDKIALPSPPLIDVVYETPHLRHTYYGFGTHLTGTVFTGLRDKTIADNSTFFNNETINETVEHLQTNGTVALVLFWFGWTVLIAAAVIGFVYLDNRWLE